MTIFVRTAKELIEQVLNQSIKDSIAEDSGTFSGFFRNSKHSEQQRTYTRDLQKFIANFPTQEMNDKESLDAIKDLISKTDIIVETFRAKKSWTRGVLNNTLSTLNSSLDRFFRILSEKTFNFIDVPDDDDPFNLLCAHAICYLGEQIICPPAPGMFGQMYETVSSSIAQSTAIEIRTKKEECLLNNIIECQRKLGGLDLEHQDYQYLRKTFVIEAIKEIQRQNTQICKESQPVEAIPVELGLMAVAKVKAPTIKPSRGRLKVAMDNALKEIETRALMVQEEKEEEGLDL